jgi:hypothetical protein
MEGLDIRVSTKVTFTKTEIWKNDATDRRTVFP